MADTRITRTANQDRTCVEHGFCRPAHRSSKNTKDWCKGRVGIPHAWMWEPSRFGSNVGRFRYEEMVCFGCGKRPFRRRRRYCVECGSHGTYGYRRNPETGYFQSELFCECEDNRLPKGWRAETDSRNDLYQNTDL